MLNSKRVCINCGEELEPCFIIPCSHAGYFHSETRSHYCKQGNSKDTIAVPVLMEEIKEAEINLKPMPQDVEELLRNWS